MLKKDNKMLVFNFKAGKHLGKIKQRWLHPYIFEEEIDLGTFKLKNQDDSTNVSTVNGYMLESYYSVEDPGVMSLKILSI